MAYTVTRHEHGIAIEGAVELSDLTALLDKWSKEGYDRIHAGIANAIGASFVLTDEAGAAAWTAEIEAKNAHRDALDAWCLGADTGISSWTIVYALTGRRYARYDGFVPNVPHDPSDLGRCIRLLRKVPRLRPQLPQVADRYPEWQPFVEHWDELEALWDEESPSGSCPKLWKRMQQLRGEEP